MTFWDSLGVFETISGDFDFFGIPPPFFELVGGNMAKRSKIGQNTSKYVFFTPNSCQKVVETPFSRAPIIFSIVASDSPSNFVSEKCIHLIFENFRFFGHSDTVESI